MADDAFLNALAPLRNRLTYLAGDVDNEGAIARSRTAVCKLQLDHVAAVELLNAEQQECEQLVRVLEIADLLADVPLTDVRAFAAASPVERARVLAALAAEQPPACYTADCGNRAEFRLRFADDASGAYCQSCTEQFPDAVLSPIGGSSR